jgi:hypothetical protein
MNARAVGAGSSFAEGCANSRGLRLEVTGRPPSRLLVMFPAARQGTVAGRKGARPDRSLVAQGEAPPVGGWPKVQETR